VSDLGDKAKALGDLAAKSGAQFWYQRPLIIAIQKDVRLYVRLPYTLTVTEELRRIITMLLEHIPEDLEGAAAGLQRFVSTPDGLQKLQLKGEKILTDLGPYAEIAEHYFNEKVRDRRFKRPTDEATREVDAITAKAKDIRKQVVDYLGELSRAIKETPGGDGTPD
jgi:hypothetical protein